MDLRLSCIQILKLKKYKFDSICVSENRDIKSGDSHILPINASSAFSFENVEDSIDIFTGKSKGFVYSRYGNPTISSVEKKLAQLESISIDTQAYCLLTSSGMSAISTLLTTLLQPGDKILTQHELYGGTTELMNSVLSKFKISAVYVDLNDLEAAEKCIIENQDIKLIYLETPSNPTLSCIDIPSIAKLSNRHAIKLAIDNTFCTSYLQQALALGADYVIYSTTKFLNGHGNSIAGAILCRSEEEHYAFWNTMKLMGTNSNAFDAWLLHNGLKTLTLRMDRHCSNALKIAEYLNDHKRVKKVNYPGLVDNAYHSIAKAQMSQFGAMLSFELEGTIEHSKKFMNSCELCTIAPTLGNADTLLLHPASSSHLNIDKKIREQNGITDGLVRVSVGIENPEDLIDDISKAIDNSFK